jgi:hypothetical protein
MAVETVQADARRLRRNRYWAVLWSLVALLAGVRLVAQYALVGMVSAFPAWVREGLLAVTVVLAVAQLVAVLLRRWTTAAILLAVVSTPWLVAALMVAEPLLAFMGAVFVVAPGVLPWLPAFVACVRVRALEERAAGGPLPADHERRVRGWAWTLVLVAAALLVTMLVIVAALHGYWWFWGPCAAVVAALLLVSVSVLRLVLRRDWEAADGRATALTAMWLAAGAAGWLVLLAPLLLAAIPCRRVALHARALAWYDSQRPAPAPAEVAWPQGLSRPSPQ